MTYINRTVFHKIDEVLRLGKSILLLGPRQTGKTTMLKNMSYDLFISFIKSKDRLRYEKDITLLDNEIRALAETKNMPCIIIDEVQKIPKVMDVVQDLIDDKIAQFILTGSSARKLKRNHEINLLPGRLIPFHMYPLSVNEITQNQLNPSLNLDEFLIFGMLPEIYLNRTLEQKEMLLDAYVNLYLEQEIRAEAIVRNLAHFSRFLELAASESGMVVNYSKLAQVIGVSHTTISQYYQILEDCLIAERIEPFLKTKTRHKLSKSKRFLIFDLGLRRIAAHESAIQNSTQKGHLFEQFVGLELIKLIRQKGHQIQLKYWRDLDGPEIDWLIETPETLIPIEVKYSDSPTLSDARHLKVFLQEYTEASIGYVICQTPRKMKLADNIYALPWQALDQLFEIK